MDIGVWYSHLAATPRSNGYKRQQVDCINSSFRFGAERGFEKLVLNIILPVVSPLLDSYQFAYKAKRGTEDAVACLLHTLLQHLDTTGNHARILFIDFSSAFNTIQRHIMITKLHYIHVPSIFIRLIYNFLSDRPQAVRMVSITSTTIIVNTGAPQGCIPSPFLYTLYTNDCLSPSLITRYFKYSDDTAILALLNWEDSVTAYHQSVAYFNQWCTDNHLFSMLLKQNNWFWYTAQFSTSHCPISSMDSQYKLLTVLGTLAVS